VSLVHWVTSEFPGHCNFSSSNVIGISIHNLSYGLMLSLHLSSAPATESEMEGCQWPELEGGGRGRWIQHDKRFGFGLNVGENEGEEVHGDIGGILAVRPVRVLALPQARHGQAPRGRALSAQCWSE